MTAEEKRVGRIYFWAAVYGIPVLALAYFQPVPDPWHLTHLSFVGVALVFQGVFLVIARDPRRFEPLLPATVFEKLCFGVPAVAFYANGQVELVAAILGGIDLMFAALFLVASRRLARTPA